MKKIKLWLKSNWQQVLLVLVLILTAGYVMNLQRASVKLNNNSENKEKLVSGEVFEYKGEEGKDALTLLKEKTEIELDKVGMVVSIDGKKADLEKREFWGFYVNGEMAQVGAADYRSKDTDIIDWRIENY
jgi:hypothetical protein